MREGGAAPASRPSLRVAPLAIAAAACRQTCSTSSRVATSPPRLLRRSPRRAPVRISTQVKVEKKDEGLEAMRKLMGGAADEDEEEGA